MGNNKRSLRYLSVCSGIEAASVAWHHLGWNPVGFSEIEPFPSAVLAHHYPSVPNYGDMTKHESWPLQPGDIDLLVGGTPCQSFSVAGLRKGLSDPRGGLMLTYLEIARRLRPTWVVWENVPGVLSSGRGRDLGSFLGALGHLGYGWAYRVLDAQYCRVDGRWPKAVPQRRRRIFVVGCLLERCARGRECAAEVLALGTGLRWHLAEKSEARKVAAPDAEAGAGAGCYWDGSDIANTLTRKGCDDRMPDKDRLFAVLQPVGYRWQNDRDGLVEDGTAPACRASAGSSGFHEMNHPVVVQQHVPGPTVMAHAFYSTGGTHGVNQQPEVSPAVKVGSGLGIPSPPAVAQAMTVRRLTPRECERLQGFPDDYTLIPWRKKTAADCPDGPRYKALGNSMAVNCMAWIGERIAAVDAESVGA